MIDNYRERVKSLPEQKYDEFWESLPKVYKTLYQSAQRNRVDALMEGKDGNDEAILQEKADEQVYEAIIFGLKGSDDPEGFWSGMESMIENSAPDSVGNPETYSQEDVKDALELGFETVLETIE